MRKKEDYDQVMATLTDCQIIHIISQVQNYTNEQTYMYAHNQVGVEGDPWKKWSRNFSLLTGDGGKLPIPVRLELERAIGIFVEDNRIKAKHFAQILEENMMHEEKLRMRNSPFHSYGATKKSVRSTMQLVMLFFIIYSIISIFIY